MKKIIVVYFVCLFMLVAGQQQAGAWEPMLKDLGNGICQDVESGLMWQTGKSKNFTEETDARAYADNLKLGGYSDWRFPTMKEAKALLAIYDLKRNGDCDITRLKSKFWLDATMEGTKAGKFEPNDECGGGYGFVTKGKGAVRAVRK